MIPEMAYLSNSRRQNYKERRNRSTNNGDMVNIVKYSVVCELESDGVSDTLV